MQKRGEKLEKEISMLEDAILYAEAKGEGNLEDAKELLEKIKRYHEQGTWSLAEKQLSKCEGVKNSQWYREFVEKAEKGRFEGDGLCEKYGHAMIKVRLSHVRWFYQCRLCGKRRKGGTIK